MHDSLVRWPMNSFKYLLLNSTGICGVYDDIISVEEIVSYFKESVDLLGKPKLFFIQACRIGELEDDGNEIDHKQRLCPPDSSDILIAHSNNQRRIIIQEYRQCILVYPNINEAVSDACTKLTCDGYHDGSE